MAGGGGGGAVRCWIVVVAVRVAVAVVVAVDDDDDDDDAKGELGRVAGAAGTGVEEVEGEENAAVVGTRGAEAEAESRVLDPWVGVEGGRSEDDVDVDGSTVCLVSTCCCCCCSFPFSSGF